MAQRPPLLRDLIPIKESISTSDYVLSLAEATTPEGAERALDSYVLTERLRDNFIEALDLIKAAVDGHTSKAAYLHGSFGSGKSHFMAVLYALLSRNQKVWGNRDFDNVLTRHEWIQNDGKKFLLVPYHMLGARSLEQRVLGRYVEYVKKLHPDAPVPQVYKTDALFDDIRGLLATMGTDAVLRGLSGDGGGTEEEEDDWGESFGWSAELLDQALAAPESHEEGVSLDLVNPSTPAELRAKLVQDASTRLLPGFAKNAAEDEHGFISLDAGLSVIAEHAKSLGYDGLILFLDELVLWLATLIHDSKLVAREAGKITNFVEGGDARRAIPIVSFIARQRDLRELVGEEVSGAAEAAIQDTLNLASGRFDKITLEDRNLPQIAHARLLTPIGGPGSSAAQQINAEFEKTKRLGPGIWDTLLGSDKSTTGADEESFRLTYPFSPAFMDTLVHISSALQRSRTGLKLMGELLAANRDHLRLGDLIAVGDLYPVIAAGGDKPFVDDLKVVFAAADKLYKTKLRPFLLDTHDVAEEDVQRYLRDPDGVTDQRLAQRCRSFVGDNRLICTLLLSALAPSVPALHDLTFRRLAALNHGSVSTPIPGSEDGVIRSKVQAWAAQFPEIKMVGTGAAQGVRLELAGVDVDSVIANARVNNNPGNRSALARRLLTDEMGIERTEGRIGGADELNLVWKGSHRTLEVVFGNVADEDQLPDHDLVPQIDGHWRIVIDLPFDDSNYGPVEDVNRVQKLREKPGEAPRTVAWLPTHLSAQRYEDFQKLVIIDRALADDQRFETQYAGHLNADNRDRAKQLLENQHEALLQQVKDAFRQAYGLKSKDAAHVQLGFDQHFHPLPDGLELKVQFGQSMHAAVRHIAGRLLEAQFPLRPDLDPAGTGTAVKPSEARTVFGYVRAAAEARDRQAEIPAKDRKLLTRLVEPLRLGTQREAYFRLSHEWSDHFMQQAKKDGVTGDLTLIQLMDWIDRPQPRGLDPFLAHLIVASFAEMNDRVWVRGGVPLTPPPELHQIKDGDALRAQPLPSEEDWREASDRFAAIFGRPAPTLRRGRMVEHFARQITDQAGLYRTAAEDLRRQLEEHAAFLGLDETDDGGRLQIARCSVELLKELQSAGQRVSGAKKTVETFARFDLHGVTPDRYGTSITRAGVVAEALAGAAWDVIRLAEGQGAEGEALLESLRGKARVDQRTADLVDALKKARTDVTKLLQRTPPPPPPGREPGQGPGPQPGPGPKPGPGKPEDVDLGTETSDPRITGDAGQKKTGADNGAPRAGRRRTAASRAANELRDELAKLPADATVEITWQVVD